MKFLVVGLGSMGKRRVRNLQRLGYKDITGFDPRAERRQEAQEKYGIQVVGEWSAAEQLAVDAWIISTPPDTHLDYGFKAAERGIHFFTEANVTDPRAEKMIKTLKKTGTVGAPSCTMRFYAGPKKIKEVLESGAIGKPLLFTYQTGQYLPDWHPWESYKDFYVSKRETGACREIVPFELAWLIPLFGKVKTLTSLKDKVTDLDADIDDVYQLLMRFEQGISGHLLVDVVARPAVRLIRINGSEGTVEWDHSANQARIWTTAKKEWEVIDFSVGTVEAGYIHSEEPYVDEMAAFVAAVKGEAPWPYSYEEDEEILDLLVQAEASSDSGRHIS